LFSFRVDVLGMFWEKVRSVVFKDGSFYVITYSF
jgi:hypothetical protein